MTTANVTKPPCPVPVAPGPGHNSPPPPVVHNLDAAPLTNGSPVFPEFAKKRGAGAGHWIALSMSPNAVAMRELRALEREAKAEGLSRPYRIRLLLSTRDKALELFDQQYPTAARKLTDQRYDALFQTFLGELLDALVNPKINSGGSVK